jgi:hypothetical protein
MATFFTFLGKESLKAVTTAWAYVSSDSCMIFPI